MNRGKHVRPKEKQWNRTVHHQYRFLLKSGMALTAVLSVYGMKQLSYAEEIQPQSSPIEQPSFKEGVEYSVSHEEVPSNVEQPLAENLERDESVSESPIQPARLEAQSEPFSASERVARSDQEPQSSQSKEEEMSEKILAEREHSFNKDWYFKLNPNGDPSKSDISVEEWKKLDLPHDWSIFFDFNHQSPSRNEGGQLDGGVAWYRKDFTLEEDQKDKNVRIQFDGVYMESQVYVNGKFLGTYPSGYNHFSYDITDYLTTDGSANVVAVKVTNKQPSSRWYSGSGIYRDVHLIVTDKVHVVVDGNHITTPKLKEQKDGWVDTRIASKIVNDSTRAAEVYVEHQIFKKGGEAVSEAVKSSIKTVAAKEIMTFEQAVSVNRPSLWTVHSDTPQLYTLKTKVFKDGQVVDVKEDTFGYRYMDWTVNEGFSLNGEQMKFHGVCIHHDHGALGAEENYKATYRKLKILKEMGVNAIRTSHNPASKVLLDVAAELGLLVQEEAFDTWYGGKKTYDYGRFFDQDATHPEAKPGEKWSDYDLRTMIERDKNNPAIIMWSLGNEVEEANGDARSIATVRRLVKDIKAIDKERYVTMGENKFSYGREGAWENLEDELDVVGMNYGENSYARFRAKHPNWRLYGSETSSATRTRGSYFWPSHSAVYHDNSAVRNYEQSDYGNDAVSWGKTATDSWTFDRDHADYAGQFIWTGFDYIGEPTPWHNQDDTPVKSSYFGIIDTTGIPKNDYYLYMSQWRSAEEHPMVHILPHWNWEDPELVKFVKNEEGKIPVRTFSNAASVELFLNGESLGKKEFISKTTADGRAYQEGAAKNQLYLEWLVDYTPGTLEAVARDAAGREIARDKVATAGAAQSVRLVQEDHVIGADGKDLAYVVYEIVDAEGNVVPSADHMVHFTLHGQGQIVGVDNGRQASRERYKAQADGSWQRQAFHGKGLVIVKSTEKEGKFTLFADSAGLESDAVTVLTAKPSKERQLVGFEALSIKTDKAQDPSLPTRVKALYSDGSSKEEAVSWMYEHSLVTSAGEKTILGRVAGTDQTAQLKLQVLDKKFVVPVVRRVAVHTRAEEIDHAVDVVMSDGSLRVVEIAPWRVEQAEKLEQEGSVLIGKSTLDGQEISAKIIVSDQEAPLLDGLLSISVDGKEVEGFTSDNTDYRIKIPYTASLPVVTARVPEGAQVRIDQASTENGNRASLYVTAEDSDVFYIYHVQFVKEAPSLMRLEIQVEGNSEDVMVDQARLYQVIGYYQDGSQVHLDPKDVKLSLSSSDGGRIEVVKDSLHFFDAGHVSVTAQILDSDKEVVSEPVMLSIAPNPQKKTIQTLFPVTVTTGLNQAPVLPQEVLAEYDKGFPRKVNVLWDEVPPEAYHRYQTFTVLGRVAGTDQQAVAKVSVEGILAVEDVSTTTPKGEKPHLPESVRTYHSNGSVIYKAVTWDEIPKARYQENGEFEVVGQVEGTTFHTRLHVRVSDQVVRGDNISKQWTGSKLPAAMVSFTGGTDHAERLNDTSVSYQATPDNRWTNWRTNRQEDWAGILFGDAGDLTKRYVDNLHVDFYTDAAIGLPKSYLVEYYVGKELPKLPENVDFVSRQSDHPFNQAENWRVVNNLQVEGGAIGERKTNILHFDKVETYAVRIRMVKQDGTDGVGLTELSIFDNKVDPKTLSKIAITVDGKALPNFQSNVYDYYLTRKNSHPDIVAKASNHGLVTVVPGVDDREPIRLILKSEEGKILGEYRLHFENAERELVDEATNISAHLPKEAPASIVKLLVEDKDEKALESYSKSIKGLDVDLYDLKFVDESDKEVKVHHPVKIKMLARAGQEVDRVLYFNPETDQIDYLSFTQRGDHIEFIADHLSIYGLSYYVEETPDSPSQGESEIPKETPEKAPQVEVEQPKEAPEKELPGLEKSNQAASEAPSVSVKNQEKTSHSQSPLSKQQEEKRSDLGDVQAGTPSLILSEKREELTSSPLSKEPTGESLVHQDREPKEISREESRMLPSTGDLTSPVAALSLLANMVAGGVLFVSATKKKEEK